jgi:hypothetical protein
MYASFIQLNREYAARCASRAFVRYPPKRTRRLEMPVSRHTGQHQMGTDTGWAASALAVSEGKGTAVDKPLWSPGYLDGSPTCGGKG